MGSFEAVEVLPGAESVAEHVCVVDGDAFGESADFLGVDAVCVLNPVVEPGVCGFDVDAADTAVQHVPTEAVPGTGRRCRSGPARWGTDSARLRTGELDCGALVGFGVEA